MSGENRYRADTRRSSVRAMYRRSGRWEWAVCRVSGHHRRTNAVGPPRPALGLCVSDFGPRRYSSAPREYPPGIGGCAVQLYALSIFRSFYSQLRQSRPCTRYSLPSTRSTHQHPRERAPRSAAVVEDVGVIAPGVLKCVRGRESVSRRTPARRTSASASVSGGVCATRREGDGAERDC